MKYAYLYYTLSALLNTQALAIPLPATDICTCQPVSANALQSSTFDESLAACNRIARVVEQWTDDLPRDLDFSDITNNQEVVRSASESNSQSWAAKLLQKQSTRESLNRADHHGFLQSDASPGRKIEQQSKPYFLHSSDSFKINCQSPPSSRDSGESMMSGQWFFATLLVMVILWLCIFELTIDICVRLYNVWCPQDTEGRIVLIGDEKAILAEPALAYQETATMQH